jgi:hypothetical protein
MVVHGLALVVAAEEAAVLEFRHDEVDKLGECAREIGRQYVVAVGGVLDEPLFKGVGNPGRGARRYGAQRNVIKGRPMLGKPRPPRRPSGS